MENNFTLPNPSDVAKTGTTKFEFKVKGFGEYTVIGIYVAMPRQYDMSFDKDDVDQVAKHIGVTIATSVAIRDTMEVVNDEEAYDNYANVMKEVVQLSGKLREMKPQFAAEYVKLRQDKRDAVEKEIQSRKAAIDNDTVVSDHDLLKAFKQLKVNDKLKYRMRGSNVYFNLSRESARTYVSGYTGGIVGLNQFVKALSNVIAELG